MGGLPDRCLWSPECIVNSAVVILAMGSMGIVPNELMEELRRSAYGSLAQCSGGGCTVAVGNDLEELDEATVRDGARRILEKMGQGAVEPLLRLALDKGLVAIVEAVDGYLAGARDLNGARASELLATALYSMGKYDRAMVRLREAREAYETVGLRHYAQFLQGIEFSMAAEAKRLRAIELHEEGRHVDEEEAIKEAARLYAQSALFFAKSRAHVAEALVNEVLSEADSAETLAHYHFLHGSLEEAKRYYEACRVHVEKLNLTNLAGDYVGVLRSKGKLCGAFSKLCAALEEGTWKLYEEAGNEFLTLVDEGFVDRLVLEGAVLALRGALELVDDLDEAAKIYIKYFKAVSGYIDYVAREELGGFQGLIASIKSRGIEEVGRSLGIEVKALKLYLFHKALEEVAVDLGLDKELALNVAAYAASMGIDPMEAGVNDLLSGLGPGAGALAHLVEVSLAKVREWVLDP